MVVTDSPQRVGQLREKLSVVTSAWFAQRYVGHLFGWMSLSSKEMSIIYDEEAARDYIEGNAG